MNTNSNFDDHSHPSPKQGENVKPTNNLTGAFDMEKRDRFELLSAYLDGEVTASERKQVQAWLDNDVEIQQLYARLLKLRRGMQTMPIPQSSQPVEETVQKVLTRVQRRSRLNLLFGGAAIAACALATVTGYFSGNSVPTPQLAQQPIERTQANKDEVSSPLMVAINDPIFPIPKTDSSSVESIPVNNSIENIDNEIN